MVVAASSPASTKTQDKIPVSKHIENTKQRADSIKVPISPKISLEDEVIALRARNKVLTGALKAVKDAAQDHSKLRHELVWYARNRCRYPNHAASKRLDMSKEHCDEIDKLRSDDGDYHHGFNSGVLAAARMFEAHADILHVNDEECHLKMKDIESQHVQNVKKSQTVFPNLNVDNAPEH